jgi:hypothetical protein
MTLYQWKRLLAGALTLIAIPLTPAVMLISAAQQDPALRALVDEAARMREDRDRRAAARRSGMDLEPHVNPEEWSNDLYRVLHGLAQYKTPEVIPPLVAFIENGGGTSEALADFGEEAVPALLPLAENRTDLSGSSALQTFQMMLTRSTVRHPLSAESKARIANIARTRLHGRQARVMVLAAIRLAVVTGERDLIDRVRLIATDNRVANELGFVEERGVKVLRNIAVQSLKEAGH